MTMVTRQVVLLLALTSLATAGARSTRSRDIQLGESMPLGFPYYECSIG